MDCVNCGAPLPPKTNLCPYCKTLNDVDLRAIRKDIRRRGESHRDCPRCNVRLQAVQGLVIVVAIMLDQLRKRGR